MVMTVQSDRMQFLSPVYVLVVALVLTSCEPTGPMEKYQPERISPVPETATWAGWIDGGSWIECSFDVEKNANWCTAWNDQSGSVMIRTFFVLEETGKGVPDNELRYSSFDGFDIELVDGRILEPLKFHGRKLHFSDYPPIDPPRKPERDELSVTCDGDDCPE